MQTETAIATPAPANAERDQILSVLRAFINSRPGLDPRNYGDVSTYRAESRAITKDRDHALTLLQYVTWTSIDAAALRAAFRDAYSGRLSIGTDAKGRMCLDYCTGQYYPTEYRRAACAVLASAIWAYWRDHCMPEQYGYGEGKFRPGDYLRAKARAEFGRAITGRWFN